MLWTATILALATGAPADVGRCNALARSEIAERYDLTALPPLDMMKVITGSDILTRQYNIRRERCLEGKK